MDCVRALAGGACGFAPRDPRRLFALLVYACLAVRLGLYFGSSSDPENEALALSYHSFRLLTCAAAAASLLWLALLQRCRRTRDASQRDPGARELKLPHVFQGRQTQINVALLMFFTFLYTCDQVAYISFTAKPPSFDGKLHDKLSLTMYGSKTHFECSQCPDESLARDVLDCLSNGLDVLAAFAHVLWISRHTKGTLRFSERFARVHIVFIPCLTIFCEFLEYLLWAQLEEGEFNCYNHCFLNSTSPILALLNFARPLIIATLLLRSNFLLQVCSQSFVANHDEHATSLQDRFLNAAEALHAATLFMLYVPAPARAAIVQLLPAPNDLYDKGTTAALDIIRQVETHASPRPQEAIFTASQCAVIQASNVTTLAAYDALAMPHNSVHAGSANSAGVAVASPPEMADASRKTIVNDESSSNLSQSAAPALASAPAPPQSEDGHVVVAARAGTQKLKKPTSRTETASSETIGILRPTDSHTLEYPRRTSGDSLTAVFALLVLSIGIPTTLVELGTGDGSASQFDIALLIVSIAYIASISAAVVVICFNGFKLTEYKQRIYHLPLDYFVEVAIHVVCAGINTVYLSFIIENDSGLFDGIVRSGVGMANNIINILVVWLLVVFMLLSFHKTIRLESHWLRSIVRWLHPLVVVYLIVWVINDIDVEHRILEKVLESGIASLTCKDKFVIVTLPFALDLEISMIFFYLQSTADVHRFENVQGF